MADAPLPLHILLLDDDPSSAETLRQMLAGGELDGEWASTYAEAARIVRTDQSRYLVLLNLHTAPEANMEFMRLFDQDTAARARCTVVDIARALGHGAVLPARHADRVIERPLTPRELLAVVRGYLDVSAS